MRSVLWWTIGGAAIPGALIVIAILPVAVAMGTDDIASNIGTLMLALLMIVPPGAVGGAAIGVVDAVLYRRVMRAEAPLRRRRARLAAFGLFALLTGLAMTLLWFTATDMTNVAFNLVVSAACAAIPATVAFVRYTRRAPTPVEK